MLLLSLDLSRANTKSDLKVIYDKIISYVLLYLHVDHYLDSKEKTSDQKKQLLKWLKDPNRKIDNSIFYSRLVELYNNIVTSSEKLNLFRMLIDITIESSAIQYSRIQTKKALADICKRKGGITVLVGYRLIYAVDANTVSDLCLMQLGECIQLLDDIIDCTIDKKMGIHTICTYTMNKYIYLDRVAINLARKIALLDKCFHLQSLALKYFLACSIERSNNFSPSFRAAICTIRYKKKGPCVRHEIEKHLLSLNS